MMAKTKRMFSHHGLVVHGSVAGTFWGSAKPRLGQRRKDNLNIDDKFSLSEIAALDTVLLGHFASQLSVDDNLTRRLVSFQANKNKAYYRWYKYKEAFSAELVEYLFHKYGGEKGKMLDPFAGTGTALFACSSLGWDADGIEILPVGQKIIEANILARSLSKSGILTGLGRWIQEKPWRFAGEIKDFGTLRITSGAYSLKTQHAIKRCLKEIDRESGGLKEVLMFAVLCILESVSYTRKDGQCLRWDSRSGRGNGKNKFNKGAILSFDDAMLKKLAEIKKDMSFGAGERTLSLATNSIDRIGNINLLGGSCLNVLPSLKESSYTAIITSPPYCNRYDYTRTYALEHALLGIDEDALSELRQSMLSCTVENRKKDLASMKSDWRCALEFCDHMPLLQKILGYLEYKKNEKELNNNGIVRMVRGYFYEMACVIQECSRVLKKGGLMFMVNDNVRYAGGAISVDVILSKIAESMDFDVVKILVLPQSKGNSSQQMGKHGKEPLRKSVCVWRKRG